MPTVQQTFLARAAAAALHFQAHSGVVFAAHPRSAFSFFSFFSFSFSVTLAFERVLLVETICEGLDQCCGHHTGCRIPGRCPMASSSEDFEPIRHVGIHCGDPEVRWQQNQFLCFVSQRYARGESNPNAPLCPNRETSGSRSLSIPMLGTKT